MTTFHDTQADDLRMAEYLQTAGPRKGHPTGKLLFLARHGCGGWTPLDKPFCCGCGGETGWGIGECEVGGEEPRLKLFAGPDAGGDVPAAGPIDALEDGLDGLEIGIEAGEQQLAGAGD